VRQRRYGAPRCRARVASCCQHVAVQVLVQGGARQRAGAREHATRSACAGLHGGVDLVRSWRHVRSRSRSSGLGN
jgi:hypothetical protein